MLLPHDHSKQDDHDDLRLSDYFGVVRCFEIPTSHGEKKGLFYSLPALEGQRREQGLAPLSRLPISIRIVLESLLRHCDGGKITMADVTRLASWNALAPVQEEIPFVVARILLQDFTGVPLLVDLAAMRSALQCLGVTPTLIEPRVPVDLVVDHSLQVDYYARQDASRLNLVKELERNKERYQFFKWGQDAFHHVRIIPPGIGICHQVNLEYLAPGVLQKNVLEGTIYYPDTLVGTDSHTTMINGLGVLGWGVGGIEAEAGMLGQPVYFLTPEVVGVHLTGRLIEGVTATDLALSITQLLRASHVVNKFVEFFGEGAASLPLPDRATIANMAPEYGATIALFPVDEESVAYLKATGRSEEACAAFESYFKAQGLFGMPRAGQLDYSHTITIDLSTIVPSIAGPKRPQDRINLTEIKPTFNKLLHQEVSAGGYGKAKTESDDQLTSTPLTHGSIVIAAITSCTNTSNPTVMLAAGLLAKKACERGLSIAPYIKTSLAPGSRVVTDYLEKTGLQHYLDELGFATVGYGCTTCIGNSGPLNPLLEKNIISQDLIVAAVLSGNRNFEARIHPSIKANFLMSPPLVVAFALAGKVTIDFDTEPLGYDPQGKPVFLHDLWPSLQEIQETLKSALTPETFRSLYSSLGESNSEQSSWNVIEAPQGTTYPWNPQSSYIQEPPFFKDFEITARPITELHGARALAIFGNSVTTDHISPAGAITYHSPAGHYLTEQGVALEDFNSYGSRRGNDRIMTRGTFANVRIKNLMLPGVEGGETLHQPSGERMSIFEAAQRYCAAKTPLIIIAGEEYGTGSSRDWAAKGTQLLGVKAVLAKSYERIHRSNLVGMGVLPLQFLEGTDATSLQLDGSELYDLPLPRRTSSHDFEIAPKQLLRLTIRRRDGVITEVPVLLRIDTAMEIDYYKQGGILPFMLRQLIASEARQC